MVKVIMGLKGSGKTKKLVDLVQQAAASEKGAVVCIEKKKNLSTEIPHSVRLIRAQEYGIFGVDMFKGYIAGLYSGNYDITQIIDAHRHCLRIGIALHAVRMGTYRICSHAICRSHRPIDQVELSVFRTFTESNLWS